MWEGEGTGWEALGVRVIAVLRHRANKGLAWSCVQQSQRDAERKGGVGSWWSNAFPQHSK